MIRQRQKLGSWAGAWAGAVSGYASKGRTFYARCVACGRQIGSDQQATRKTERGCESIHVACISRAESAS